MVSNKLLSGICLLALGAFVPACDKTQETPNANANANANATAPSTSTRPGPDNSEITTTTDANGVRTETRVFKNNPRVSRVIVTTRNGQRTVKAYSPSGEERELNKKEAEDVLEATGTAIADAAGWVADKTVEGAKATGEAAKTVGAKTVEGAKTVGSKTAEGAKTVGEKTVTGAKKAGSAIKKVVTP